MTLDPLRRVDESADALFYRSPRFVEHIDARAIAAVTQVYRETLPADGPLLDLMSSWISHLPPEVEYPEVVGLGMNADELARNPRLDSWVVHDLNRDPSLPFEAARFASAVVCVSIDYLTRPVEVLADLSRVVRAGGPLVVTFSDRCFPSKAVVDWLEADDAGRASLIRYWLVQSGGWGELTLLDRGRKRPAGDPLYAMVARSLGGPVDP